MKGLLGSVGTRLGGLLEPRRPEPEEAPENRRRTPRLSLPLAVQVCAEGGRFAKSQLVDINLGGFGVECPEALVGASIAVVFEGIPSVLASFSLVGEVVRASPGGTAGVRLSRDEVEPEVFEKYRALVLFYLRRRPLLEQVASGYSEARCEGCGWVGRVGQRKPNCSRCGGMVEFLRA